MANQKHTKFIRSLKSLLLTLDCKVDYIGTDELKVSNNTGTFILKINNQLKNNLRTTLRAKGATNTQIETALIRLGINEPQYISFYKIPKTFAVVSVPANTPIQAIKKLVKYGFIDEKIINNSAIKYDVLKHKKGA